MLASSGIFMVSGPDLSQDTSRSLHGPGLFYQFPLSSLASIRQLSAGMLSVNIHNRPREFVRPL